MQIACRRAKVLFVSLLFVFSFVVIAPAQSTIHVPADVPSIQQAIFQANNGDVVLVSPGTYFEVLNFQGKAITVQSTDGPAVTIIDAQNSFSAVSFTNGEGPGAVLRGFTVTHGFGSQEGGGIEIVNGSPTIDGNVITANQACSGSGISANRSSSVISNNTISNNSTSACTPPQGGAGIRIVGAGNVHLLNNTITGNQITNGGNGGGVVVDVLAAPLVSGNLIQNNSTVGNGGGIAVNSSALLVNNVIANNSAATGGGIYSLLNQAQPSFLNNTVAGNSANQGAQLFIDGLDANVEIANNLLIDFSGEGAVFCGTSAGQVPPFDHNDVFSAAPTGAPAAAYTGSCTDQTGISGNINADPDFVFGPGPQPDFHLQLSSPALDAGDNSAANLPATDRDGNIRIAASNTNTCSGVVDMGAYEVVAPSTGTGVLSSSSLDFGTAFIGLPPYPTQQLTFFANGGCVQPVVSTMGDFQQTNTCGPMLGGGSCTIQLTFNPTAPGLRVGTLLVKMGSGVQPATATLTGQSYNSGSVFPTSLDFGGQLVQTTSSSQSVSVFGNGNAPLQVTTISVSGDFAQIDNSCLGSSGSSCFIDLTFTPSVVGLRTGTLTVGSNQGTFIVPLSGTGLGPMLSVNPSSLVFASQTVGTMSPSQTITLTNSGQASLSINAVNVNPAFLVQPLTCSGTVSPGSSCTYSVAFSPQNLASSSGADYSGTLEFDTNAGKVSVALSATVTAPLVSLSPQTLIFAPQQIGSSSAPQTVTMTNISGAPLQLSSIGASNNFLAISSCPTTLDVNASCTVDVSLAPNTAGPYNGFLSVVPSQFGGVVTAVLSSPDIHQILHVPGDFPSIQSAIFAAQDGDTVLVSPGTYFEQINFFGKAISLVSTNGPGLTILDGENAFVPILMSNNEPPEAVVRGFTITHGRDSGIALIGASPTIEDNVITSNTDCNSMGGAGIMASFSSALIQHNTITNNDGTCNFNSTGGGILIENTGSLGPARILNNVITGNQVLANGGGGITVGSFSKAALIQNNVIENNTATSNGGGILVSGGGSADLVNNLVAENSAANGGGIYFSIQSFGDSPLLLNNTVANNVSGSNGSAVYIDGGDANFVFTNNLFVDSTGLGAVYCGATDGQAPNFFNNDVVSLVPGVPAFSGLCQGVNTIIGSDPQFVDPAHHNYHLQPSSPAIDAGTILAGSMPDQDLDGKGRIGPGNAQTCIGAIDMGAYEFELSNSGTALLPPVEGLGGDPIQAFVGSSETIGISISASGCVHLSSVQTTANFKETDSCGGAVSSGSFCQILVTFSPTDPGIRRGTLKFDFGKSSPPQTLAYNGLGLEGSTLASATSLGFGNQPVGTSSATQSVSLFPLVSGLPLEINGIWLNGDFSQTNDCNTPDPPIFDCTFTITFTPTATGMRTGTLVVSTNQGLATVSLSGSGNTGAATLTPASLAFGNQLVNTVSAAQFLTLTNTGQTTMSLGASSATGDFAVSSQCGPALTAGASCTYAITFKPAAIGTRSGTFTVQTDAGPFTASLTGTGIQPAINVSPTAVNFGDESINSTAPSQTITVTNVGSAPLHISSTLVNGDPDLSVILNNCTSAVPPTLSCTIEVGFTPRSVGPATATLSIGSDAPVSPTNVALTGNGLGPLGSPSPSSLNFGNQLVNTSSAAQTVTLSNTGTDPLTISGISVSGDFTQSNTCPATLAVGSSCTIQVTFAPTATGARNGSVIISSNSAPPAPAIALTGTGIQPAISVSPATIAFGNQSINTEAPAQTISVTNPGTATLHINSLVVSGDADFFTSNNNCVAGTGVVPGGSCSIQVEFFPHSAGSGSATLTIGSDAASGPVSVSLSGTGVNPVIATVSPSVFDFGNRAVGTQSPAQIISLTNTGTGVMTVSGVTITGDPDFILVDNGCAGGFAAGITCSIQIAFAPKSLGAGSATLTITSNASNNPVSVALSGTGVTPPAASVSPASINFGSVSVGTQNNTPIVTVSNTGGAPLDVNSLTMSGDSDFFVLLNNCSGAVAPGGSCTIQMEFRPVSAGPGSATLTIGSNASNGAISVSLSGTGVNPAMVSVSPAAINFGNQAVGAASAPQTVSISNTGTVSLHITALTISGDPDFATLNNSCPLTAGIPPGTRCSVQVVFGPRSLGPGSATLTITSDAANNPVSVSLSGTGVNPPKASTSPSSLSFGGLLPGTESAPQTVTVSNIGGSTLLINSQLVTGDSDFFVSNSSCVGGAGVAPGSSCSIQVVFFPHSGGSGSATLTVGSNDPAAPQQSVTLTGTGIDYAISAPASLSVRSGDKIQPTITVSALGGNFSNAVSLSCSGLPSGASCSFSPTSVIPGATSASSRLTINTQQSGGIKTPLGTYSITVLGTSNGLTHSAVVILTVTN